MTVKPRTIDNLGVDASIRYAKDQQLFEAGFIEASRLIPQKTVVSVAKPYALSEFDQKYSVGKTISWALFSPPPQSSGTSLSLFSYQLIPSLGGYEKIEADSDKLECLEPIGDESEDKSEDERKKEEKERLILLALFQCLNKLDKALALINSRRNQYQRG